MANVVEIVLRSKDNATIGIRGAKKELDAFVASTVKSGDYTVIAGKKMTQSYADATRAASLLSNQIGVAMPQAIGNFLAKSELIGPVLSKAFSALAVVGLVEVILQIPAAIDKAAGALTGWDTAAQEAYKNQIALNEKYVDRLRTTQAELEKMAIAAQKTAVATTEAAQFPEGQVPARFGAYAALGRALGFGNAARQAAQSADERSRAATLAASANMGKPELSQMGQALQDVLAAHDEMLKKIAEDAKKAREEMLRLMEAGQSISLRMAAGVNETPMRLGPGVSPMPFIDMQGIMAAATARGAIEGIDFEGAAGSAQAAIDRSREFANKQAEIVADAQLNASKQVFERQQEQARRLGQILNDSLGAAWDSMFIRGQSVLSSLANFAAGIGNAIGRTFFQAAGQTILAGQSGRGGVLGLASKLPGIGGLLGTVGLGTAGAATLGSTTVASLATPGILSTGALAGITPVMPAVTVGGIGGGAAAGGAGFAGLSATAAIPIVGGVVGAALLAFHFLRRRTQEAPFSQDPNAIERNRTYFFHTATQVNEELIMLLRGVRTMTPGALIKDGLPVALGSSNTFRRDMEGMLADDT